MFQFPSNGKGHAKGDIAVGTSISITVSIPFKRERACKDTIDHATDPEISSFQFPSNGKGHAKKNVHLKSLYSLRFQFPSNGKGHAKQQKTWRTPPPWRVSIPFKRERACKEYMLPYRFPSHGLFQFPSNGKGHAKRPYFAPSRAVAPYTPKPNANCAGLFFSQNLPLKSHKPLWPLTQTRFFDKIGSEVRCHLGSWAIYAASARDR